MRKRMPGLLTCMLLATLLLIQCKKPTDNVVVLTPPTQSIVFSNVSDFILDSTGKTVSLQAKVSSPNGLQKVEILYQPWNLAQTITATGNDYTLNEPLTIPVTAALKIHSITLKATDSKGGVNMTDIKIGLQDLNYPKIYLTNATSGDVLNGNLFGVPVSMNKLASHTYEVIYYARTAGELVRFIPNKTSLAPVAIGTDPANAGKLITDATKSLPVKLGAPGYYKINVNTLLLNYSITPYTPTGTAPSEVALVGRGFFDYPNMNWQNALPDIILMDKDPNNPFLFTKSLKLGVPAGASYNTAQFIMTTNNGWTNFWRFDNGSSPEYAVFNGGTNADLPITTTPVTYLFVFDAQTNLVQAIKQ